MAARIHELAGAALIMALAVGCGSGGPGTSGAPPPAGPAPGQDPGFGVREEDPGRGFDSAEEHAESPGRGLERPGGPAPGPGPGGEGGGDYVGICKKLCKRSAKDCDADEAECSQECEQLAGARGHACEGAVRAAFHCADTASNFVCENGAATPVGCEKEIGDFLACLGLSDDFDDLGDDWEDWIPPSSGGGG